MSSSEPPPPNPVLSAYETFVRDTPLVTRYTITTICISWLASFFFDPSFALSNIPYFTIFKFEIYRIILSPLVCQSILSVVFAYISFVDHGKRLEFSMGSTAFGWLMITLAVMTNVVFLLLSFMLYGLMRDQSVLYMPSTGIWIILFGLIAIECVKAPAGSKRKLFFCDVPTLYYPLGLLAVFSLLAGVQLSYFISTGVGYLYGRGHLDRLKMSESRFKQWESTVLANFTRREGWIVGQAATGSDAWNDTQNTGFSLFQRAPASSASAPSQGLGVPSAEAAAPTEGFPKRGGRTLGGPTRRPPTAEARAAMLEAAAARRAQDENV